MEKTQIEENTLHKQPNKKNKWYKNLIVQVMIAVILGMIVGYFKTPLNQVFINLFGFGLTPMHFKQFADLFIKLVKMIIVPIIFLSVSVGIGGMGNLKSLGRIGGKALIYFELVTTLALVIGLVVVNLTQPGVGFDISKIDYSSIESFEKQVTDSPQGIIAFISSLVPDNFFHAIADVELLPVLFISVLFGVALAGMGNEGKIITESLERFSHVFFKIINIIMKIAPLAVFCAMTYTVALFGIESLASLGKLMLGIYLTMLFFIVGVLGFIAWRFKFNIFKFIAYIKEEILLTWATSSSETALPRLMDKLTKFGCDKTVVGLVVPTGYTFNLDGTSIYLTMAAMFIAQAYGVELTLGQQAGLIGVLLFTSKGAAGVAGAGIVTLAATLATFKLIPIGGIALILGIDRFMSDARGITNIIGNSVATVVIAKSEKKFDEDKQKIAFENLSSKKVIKDYA